MLPPYSTYKIAVAVQNDSSCYAAIERALNLAKQLKSEYKLWFVYCVPQNAPSKLPYFDHLDKAYNLEIQEEAKRDIRSLLHHLDTVTAPLGIEYEFVMLEEQQDLEEMLKEFCVRMEPDLFFVGSHRMGLVKKLVIGSVSQFCLDNLPCPVVLVKPAVEESQS